ncbi:ABC transporter ATP-binding protein [Roseofilum casamattae]|uniref:ABC transporter ATP-binding protein n=1 Tax=Roseofilum casamattae BLCC-M143 TaxID=3022442 RepID=A0ABT7BYE6_9CYAN|nr:ABC transporter ATP-binding protein [Roseofilum casamattae]MDJ1184226.1 ABC transporter ATP-binding protein [Roseofilum casamattae BLCC-M143]
MTESSPSLLPLLAPYRIKLIISCLLSILARGLQLVPFILIYLGVTAFLHPPVRPEEVWPLVGIAAIAILLRWIMLAISGRISHQIAYNIIYDIRIKIAEKLGKLPLSYLNRSSTGMLKKIINEDVEYLEQMLAHGIPEGIGLITIFFLTVFVLFLIDWRMALAALGGIPFSIGSQYLLFKDLQPILKDYYESQDCMNATVIEYVRGMPAIKAFTQTVESFDRYEKSVRNYQEIEEKWSRQSLLPWTLFSVSVSLNLIIILPVGLHFFQEGNLSLATLILFLLLGVGVSAPLLRLLESVEVYVQTQKGLERIFTILNEPELPESETLELPQDLTLEFCDVSFAYEKKEVLQNINLKIVPGRVIALVGSSGSGKTTIAKLLGRFWEVSDGEISLGGININRFKLNDLLSKMAFVFQEVSLFNDTIYNNISMGKPNASREEVFFAAKAAQCHDFIASLPQGYNTIIGERGAKLSGGQKQRISIARAILKDAPIVILDEATAFLDPESEAQVQAAISQLVADKTLLVIAHRLFTIVDADRIIVMDKGKICDRGSHAELLETCEIYRHLWDAHLQAKGWTLQERQGAVFNAVSSPTLKP